jgi:hypothetical protein
LLDAPRYPKVLIDELALTYLLRERLHCRKSIICTPLLGDLALRNAVDPDTYERFLLPGRRRYAQDLALLDAALGVLGDYRVILGDLLLDGDAGDGDIIADLRYRALVVLTGGTLSGSRLHPPNHMLAGSRLT